MQDQVPAAPMEYVEDVGGALGLNQEQFKRLQGVVSFNDPVFRVVSLGTAGKATRTVQMVFRRIGVMPQVITWREF